MSSSRHTEATRVLALAPNWLGDAVMCTPALRALHLRHSGARLTVAGRAGVCALLQDLPWIDGLVSIPAQPSVAQMTRLAKELRPHGRDLVAVFPHSFRAALLARLIGGRRRIGYARNGRAWLLTDTLAPHREQGRITPVYMSREYLDLVALVGCEDDGAGLELGVSEAAIGETASRLAGSGPLIGIAPGAAFGPSKRWMPEAFAETANLIAAACNARFLLLTGPGEEDIRDTIRRHAAVNFLTLPPVDDGIAVLKAALSQVDLLICNDSGPRHIAVAFKRPIVCIMGPTSPRYSEGPYEIGQVLRQPLECSPCQKPVCPLEHHRCMHDITPEQAAQTALAYLAESAQASAAHNAR